MNASLRTLGRVRDLCLFRAGPQDLPYSPRAVIALLVVGVVLETFWDFHQGGGVAMVIAANLGSLAALAALRTLLGWRGAPERFVQTALAMLASGLLFEVLVLPLLLYVGHPLKPEQVSGAQLLAALAIFILLLWQIGISVRILRSALQVSVPGAVLALFALGFVDVISAVLFAAAFGAT